MPSEPATKEQTDEVGHKRHVHQWIKSNSSTTDNLDLPSEPVEGGLATKLYNACLQTLQSLYRLSLAQNHSQAHTVILKEELAKLFLWGESFRSGELDQVLAFAEGLREVVFEKFIEIGRLLLGLMNLPDFTEAKKLRSYRGLNALLEEAKLVVVRRGIEDNPEQSDSSSDDNSDDESHIANQDFAQICKWLQTQTSQLTRIGPAVRRSLARLEKNEFESRSAYPPVVPFQVSGAAGAYVSLVRDRFKDASPDLAERLGEANWQRHQSIRNVPIDSDTALEPASTAIFRPVSTFYDSGLGTSVPAGNYDAQSHTSFLSSNTNGELGDLRVPPMPREAQLGKPFKCFLCKETITCIRNRVDWKIHVFADLRPYICTFPGCKEELAQFSSRVEWGEHEFKYHRIVSTWRCPDCPEICSKLVDYENHIQSIHGRQQDSVTWQTALDLALDKQESPAELEQCPLCCATPGSSRRKFVNHVARHMEQIALTALPRDVEGSDDEVDAITSESLADDVPIPDAGFSTFLVSPPGPPTAPKDYPSIPPTLNTFEIIPRLASSGSGTAPKEKPFTASHSEWTAEKDRLLVQARSRGLDWVSVATKHFPDKTADACEARFMTLKADAPLEATDERPCDLTKHEKTHSRPWKCSHPSCKYATYGWPTEKERDRHVNYEHSATLSIFKCKYYPCPYESKRESNCKQHMEKVHGWTYVRSKNMRKIGKKVGETPSKSPPTPQATLGSNMFDASSPDFGDPTIDKKHVLDIKSWLSPLSKNEHPEVAEEVGSGES